MRKTVIPQIRVVTQNNAKAFEDEVNEALKATASKNAQIHFNMNLGHCLYILYEEEQEVCETAEDDLAKRGIHLHCRNCPIFQPELNKDGTIRKISKRGDCHISMYGTTTRDSIACEYFCKAVLNGELKPIHDDVIAEMLKGED